MIQIGLHIFVPQVLVIEVVGMLPYTIYTDNGGGGDCIVVMVVRDDEEEEEERGYCEISLTPWL